MKAAYLAYDKNSLATLSVLSNYFEQIDFYLVDSGRAPYQVDLNEAALLVDTFSIPADESLQTAAHKKVLQSIRKELPGLPCLRLQFPKHNFGSILERQQLF